MLTAAKCLHNMFLNYSKLILAFWTNLSVIAFLSAVAVDAFYKDDPSTQTAHEMPRMRQGQGNESGWLLRDDHVRLTSSLVLCLLPSLLVFTFSYSLALFLSTLLSSLLSFSLLHIAFCLRLFPPIYRIPFYILHALTVSNTAVLRNCWNRSRRGPCESMIGRLMLLSIDRHLPSSLVLLCSAFLLPLVCIPVDYTHSAIPAIIFSFVSLLQSVASQMILLSVMMLRHQCNMTCPSVPHSVFRPIQASVQEKIIYVAHFICQLGKKTLLSTAKIPIVVIYFTATLAYISFVILRRIYRDSVHGAYLDRNCPKSVCIFVDLSWLSLLVLPLLLFLLVNRLHLHSLTCLCALIAGLCVFTSISPHVVSLPFFYYALASLLSAHFSLMYCMAYRASRRKSVISKVLDGLNFVFPASTFSLCSILLSFLVEYLLNQRIIYLQFSLLTLFIWVSIIIFVSCAMTLFGDWTSCSRSRRSSHQSDSLSARIEGLSSNHLYESDIRKYSATHYYGSGAYKKKSFCSLTVVDENRRASMPAVIHQRVIHKEWTEAAKRCRSIDEGARLIKKKEALLQSRGSMCSATSSNANANAIIEE